MKELKPTKLFAIPINEDISDIDNFICDSATISGFNGKKWITDVFTFPKDIIGTDFKYLGTATKEEISFDVEPFVEEVKNPHYPSEDGLYLETCYKNYIEDGFYISEPEYSFYSLLKANECYFENEIKEPNPNNYSPTNHRNGKFKRNYESWQSAQEKVSNKYLIIEKL